MFEPAIKWSGSKRSQAEEIIKYFPKEIETYYEPFCGGCSVLRRLLEENITVHRYICSDLNGDLINLWNMIKEKPEYLSNYYENLWKELNKDSGLEHFEDTERKKEYFYEVRKRYNKEHKAEDFLFIMRTTTNGMPRYNGNGEFNNSFHVTRNGIQPEKLRKILNEWSDILNKNNVQFIAQSYEKVSSKKEDLLYLDPPYANINAMYFGNFNHKEFFEWLRKQDGYYILSFDGKSGDIDNTKDVPKDIYSKHIYLKSGNSSFKRTIGKSKDSIVYESVYLK